MEARKGWKTGPKLKEHENNDGIEIRKDDIALVIAVWNSPAGQAAYAATRWFCIFIPERGFAWFPDGWLLTVDSSPWKEWNDHCNEYAHRRGGVSYGGFCD